MMPCMRAVPALPPAALSSAATAAGSTQASPLYINTPSPPPPDVGISFERLADSGHWMYDVQVRPGGDQSCCSKSTAYVELTWLV